MEEPLIGSWKRPNLQINQSLFQIPEEAPVDAVATPSSIKEKLIFGSPDFNLRGDFVWLDYSPRADSLGRDRQGGEDNEPRKASEPDIKAFDDSFMDTLIMGSHTSGHRLSPDLTRLDLDVRSPQSPRQTSTSAFPSTFTPQVEGGTPAHGEQPQFGACHASPNADHHSAKKHLHRSRTAPAMAVMADKPRVALRLGGSSQSSSPTSVVSQAFIGLLVYLAVGVLIYTWREDEFSGPTTHGIVDALYFCIVTMCTIGYGDITPSTPLAKLFSCAFVLVGFGFIDILLSGMVSYVLDRQEALLLSAVTAGHHETAKNYLVDVKKGRMRIRLKVALAFGVVTMCIGVGTLVMHLVEDLGWLDSFYLSCMSVTTVGYGDHAFKTMPGRLFASVWLLVSTLAVARSFLYLAEARIDKRHRLIAKLVLEKEMTFGDLLAADLDNDGSVSKSDFVVYKLKQMGKIEEKDVHDICRQFSRLDSDNVGKITLSCLINLHEASAFRK